MLSITLAWTNASLTTVKQIRGEFGCTVNDVVLAAIRCVAEEEVITNCLPAVLVNLPVAEPDPILGQLSFGITAESTAAPDLDILTEGIHHGLAELDTRRPKTARPVDTGGDNDLRQHRC